MKSRPKGRKAERVVRYVRKDGTVAEYHYEAYRHKPLVKPTDTIDALIDAYWRSPEWHKLAESTKQHRKRHLRPLARIGHLAAKSIVRKNIISLRNGVIEGHGDAAGQQFVRVASAMFTWAVRNDWLEHNPAWKVWTPPSGEWPAWTARQADAAQATLPEPLRRVVVLGRYTGQRRSDLCAMTWAAFSGDRIRVKQEKGGAELVIPCHPTLRAELLAWQKQAKDAVTILTNFHGRPWRLVGLSQRFTEAMKETAPGLNVHGLRKLAATSLADAGCTPHEIMAITGHRTLAMVELYTRSADQERLAGAAIVRLQNRDKKRRSGKA